jgi:primosomal protein N'
MMNVTATPGADFDKMHLQWFAEGEEPDDEPAKNDEGGNDEEDVKKRLSKLEKSLSETVRVLEEERKASAGKDKKITELSAERRKLQESTLSKDKLLEIREKELEDAKAEWEQQRATERLELENLRIESLRREVLSKLENFPAFLMDRVRGTNKEEIEADARNIMKMWVKDRNMVDNVRKTTGRPQSGTGKQVSMSADDVKNMTPEEKRRWAETATDEEYAAVFDELHS